MFSTLFLSLSTFKPLVSGSQTTKAELTAFYRREMNEVRGDMVQRMQLQLLPSRRKTIELSCRYVELYFQSELKSVIVDFQRSF
jgi:hypothetical protein